MSFHVNSAGALAGESCDYGTSRLQFRGPQRPLDEPYMAVLGTCETFGRFVQTPFAALAEDKLDMPVVNLGVVNAGLDSFLRDDKVIDIAKRAQRVAVQTMDPQNLSNRLYRVHPRRNDRFLAPSELLRQLYPDFDFTEINFTKDLLQRLHDHAPERFDIVEAELRKAWTARMRTLLGDLWSRAVVIRIRYRNRIKAAWEVDVSDRMLADLKDCSSGIVDVAVDSAADAGELDAMQAGSLPQPAAAALTGPSGHRAIAAELARALQTDPEIAALYA